MPCHAISLDQTIGPRWEAKTDSLSGTTVTFGRKKDLHSPLDFDQATWFAFQIPLDLLFFVEGLDAGLEELGAYVVACLGGETLVMSCAILGLHHPMPFQSALAAILLQSPVHRRCFNSLSARAFGRHHASIALKHYCSMARGTH
jgi:hypothetical protein